MSNNNLLKNGVSFIVKLRKTKWEVNDRKKYFQLHARSYRYMNTTGLDGAVMALKIKNTGI